MPTVTRIFQIILCLFMAFAVGAILSYPPGRLNSLETAAGCMLLFFLGLCFKTSGGQLAMEMVEQVREDMEVPQGTGRKLQFVHSLVREWHEDPTPEMGEWVAQELYDNFAVDAGLDPLDMMEEGEMLQ